MIVLTKVVQTCSACPSQWDAWDADGNYYYLRFRFGHGKISKENSWPDFLADFTEDDEWAGCIDLQEFMKQPEIAEVARLADNVELVDEVFRGAL